MKAQKTVVIITGILIFSFFVASLFYFLREERVISEDTSEKRSGFSGIFPSIGGDPDQDGPVSGDDFDIVSIPVLRQITTSPIAGAYSFGIGDGEVVVRYVERETGHVLETTTLSLETERISNETVPRVHEALFVEEGRSVIMRYLDGNETIKTIYKTIERSPEEESGNALFPNNIPALAISKDTKEIFYLTELSNGVNGFLSSPNGTDKKLIFTSPIKEWSVDWNRDEIISLNTKPANNVDGFLFLLNSGTREFKKTLAGIPGLISLMGPTSENILYSTSDDFGTALNNIKGGVRDTVVDFTALAEKCVWSELKDGVVYCASSFSGIPATYPDDWYKGLVSFGDDVWIYNTESRVGEIFFDLEAEGRELDITNMFLDAEETHIFFTNKKDLTLWSLRIKEPIRNTTTTTSITE